MKKQISNNFNDSEDSFNDVIINEQDSEIIDNSDDEYLDRLEKGDRQFL